LEEETMSQLKPLTPGQLITRVVAYEQSPFRDPRSDGELIARLMLTVAQLMERIEALEEARQGEGD
jgi:hypothetical protein